jgi:hypothetical protein
MMWFIQLRPTTTRASTTLQPVFGAKFSSSTTLIGDSTALPSKKTFAAVYKTSTEFLNGKRRSARSRTRSARSGEVEYTPIAAPDRFKMVIPLRK